MMPKQKWQTDLTTRSIDFNGQEPVCGYNGGTRYWCLTSEAKVRTFKDIADYFVKIL